MTKSPDNYLISILAKRDTASLSKLADDVDDEETARVMYADAARVVNKLADRFKFRKTVKIENDGGLRK